MTSTTDAHTLTDATHTHTRAHCVQHTFRSRSSKYEGRAYMESDTTATPIAEPGSPTTRSILALKQRAAVLEVSRPVPNASSLHVPRAALCLDRSSLAKHLEAIIAEKHKEWDAFQETRIVQRNDGESGSKKVGHLVNGGGTSDESTSTTCSRDDGKGGSGKPTPRANVNNASPPALRLKGLRSGPLAHLMGLYSPCQSESGLVLHNGQVLYRLHRKHLSLQTAIEG